MCQIIYCYNPAPSARVHNGVCTTGGTGSQGGSQNLFLIRHKIFIHEFLGYGALGNYKIIFIIALKNKLNFIYNEFLRWNTMLRFDPTGLPYRIICLI